MLNHNELKVVKLAKANAIALYKISRNIRGSDNLSIRSQLIRAAFSIPANIVEGNSAPTAKEFSRFVHIAMKSAHELDFHLEIVQELELLSNEKSATALANNEEVRKMLGGLLKYLERRETEEAQRKGRK